MIVSRGQLFSELVALGLIDLVTPARRALRVGAALVRFVNDDEVPTLLPDALSYIILFGVVEGGDYKRFPLPEVDELLLVVAGMNDLKRLAEEAHHLVLPLDGQRSRHHDEAAFNRSEEERRVGKEGR